MKRSVFDELDVQHYELAEMLGGLDAPGWQTPTRCEGWGVADVVLHLAQTDQFVIAGCKGEISDELAQAAAAFSPEAAGVDNVDDAAELAVQRERGLPPDQLLTRWRAGSSESRQLLRDRPDDQRIPWVIGTLPPRTLATTRLSEYWIHTGDIAEAIGSEVVADDRLWHIARLAWRTLPYAFSRSGASLGGAVALYLTAPSGEHWEFEPDEPATTTVTGSALEWCQLAARRKPSEETSLRAEGRDGEAVLTLARTYA